MSEENVEIVLRVFDLCEQGRLDEVVDSYDDEYLIAVILDPLDLERHEEIVYGDPANALEAAGLSE